ncbi:MAG: dGTP triphosphohydrolase, partial [Acidobacteriota bacterium]
MPKDQAHPTPTLSGRPEQFRPARLEDPIDIRREHSDPQKPHDTRTEFERDRSRILHAQAFRLLQSKTQVFYGIAGASFRTRLTHSMEVALIAKALARKMGADSDLCETVALAHDLGHPPFGHNGEAVLNELLIDAGGFEANAQTLRIVRRLEAKGHRYLGLNLTYATLDGILKYKVPFTRAVARSGKEQPSPVALGERTLSDDARDLLEAPSAPKCVYDEDWSLVETLAEARGTGCAASFECRILDLADDIAYCVADLQDGLMMGFLEVEDLRRATTGAHPLDEILEFLDRQKRGWSADDVIGALGELVELYDLIAGKRQRQPVPGANGDFYRNATGKELASKLHRELVHAVDLDGCGRPKLAEHAAMKITVLKAVTRTQVLGDPRLTTL